MIRSVSMSLPRSGIGRPATRVMRMSWLMIVALPETSPRPSPARRGRRGEYLPYVDDRALQRRRGDHRWAHQQRTPGRAALPAFEVAIARRSAHLAANELVRVNRQAHRAPGQAPLESGAPEDRVE